MKRMPILSVPLIQVFLRRVTCHGSSQNKRTAWNEYEVVEERGVWDYKISQNMYEVDSAL